MKDDSAVAGAIVPVASPTPEVELIPQPHGGALRRGNPGHKGRPPSWIREQLREGLVQALPRIRHALRTGKDKRTGQPLSWADLTKTVEVVAKISMPVQTQVGGLDGAPFTIVVGRAPEAEQVEGE
jgi:hypothetical protein